MSRNARAMTIIAAGAAAIIVLAIFWTLALAYTPFAYSYPDRGQQAVSAVTSSNGVKHVTINLSIQQTTNRGPHGNWLGYQLQPPAAAQTSPANTASALSKYQYGATVYTIPAHALVTVIVHNFDSATFPRNPYFAQVTGTVGGVAYCNANGLSGDSPPCGKNGFSAYSVANPNVISHTFTIPDLGINVPMVGIPATNGFVTMKFQFRAPGKSTIRWQCIIPCGAGTYGFGGPMSQFGYMNGLFQFV